MIKKYKNFVLVGLLVGLVVATRLVDHIPNFTPVAAVAIFAGLYLSRRKWAVIVPLAAMFIADLFLGFYEPILMVAVYGSFALVGLAGIWLRKHKNFGNIILVSLGASLIFYLVTNFAVWAFTPWYPKTIFGLLSSYTLALPFWRNMLMGDLFYIGALVGGYEAVVYLAAVIASDSVAKRRRSAAI